MEKVSIVKCGNYSYKKVEKKVFQCLGNIEDLNKQIKRGSKVLVKPDLAKKNFLDEAVTTHPYIVEGVVRYLQNLGCEVIIGDSPEGPFNEKTLRTTYKATGMFEVQKRTGCQLNFDTSYVEVKNNNGKFLKGMKIVKSFNEVDLIISVAKLKTHTMMIYTGGVKNLFGIIPGLTKADYRLRMNSIDDFSNALVDVSEYIKPIFSIIDAIEGMEGDGPFLGDKRSVGLIMASQNIYALDTVASYIMGIEPSSIPTINTAKEREIFNGDIDSIEILGEELKDIVVKSFKSSTVSSVYSIREKTPKFLEKWILNNLVPKPIFNHDICISCKTCANNCPSKSIDISSGYPDVDLKQCIRCFSCYELCPKGAVEIKKSKK